MYNSNTLGEFNTLIQVIKIIEYRKLVKRIGTY
jgi:hypothetical protein